MAIPSLSMCPVPTGDTNLCSVGDGISLTEMGPPWLGVGIHCSVTLILEVIVGIAIEEPASTLSSDLGALPMAPYHV